MSKIEPATIFAALGDPTRLTLVGLLSRTSPRSIASLTEGTTISRQAITKHLHLLERAGLVRAERIGRERRFAYRPEGVTAATSCLAAIGASWEAALGRMKDFVEHR